ncbi:hypothetical protein Tco_1341058 [Tanacetum coccineum]
MVVPASLDYSLCQPRIDASMWQNPTDSHLEGKPQRRDSNLRPLACGNNLPKDTLGGQLSYLGAHVKVGTSGCVSQPDWPAVICGA